MTTHGKQDPDHKVIERPWEFEIVELHYHRDTDGVEESYIELHLKKNSLLRRLRFLGPCDLQIEKGFPAATNGMEILDISGRQWAGLTVAVDDFEAGHGAIRFFAREVIDLDSGGTR